jgi:hypothetical protein
MISAINSATDEYCLTYEATGAGFEWQSCTSQVSLNSCDGLTPCARIVDTDADREIIHEFRTALNSVLYPGGTLTSSSTVYIGAPVAGTYTMTATSTISTSIGAMVNICFSSSTVTGSNVIDCSGSASTTLSMPKIVFTGDWDRVILDARFNDGTLDTSQKAYVLKIGDVTRHGYVKSEVVEVDMPKALNIKVTNLNDGSDFNPVFSQTQHFICDGCGGNLNIIPSYGTIGTFQVGRTATIIGPGQVRPLTLNVTANSKIDSQGIWETRWFYLGNLRGVYISGLDEAVPIIGIDDSSNLNNCSLGSVYTTQTCYGLTFTLNYILRGTGLGTIYLGGAGLRFYGTTYEGIFFRGRFNCSESFFENNLFAGRAYCNFPGANSAYCIRTSSFATYGSNNYCERPNALSVEGSASQLAADNPNRNSPYFVGGSGLIYFGSSASYNSPSTTANFIASCHTSASGIGQAYSWNDIEIPYKLNFTGGVPPSNTCLNLDGTGTSTCGSIATKWYAPVDGFVTNLKITANNGVNANRLCRFRVLKNGSATGNDSTSVACSESGTAVYWGGTNTAGTIPYDDNLSKKALRGVGSTTVGVILDPVNRNDYLELMIENDTSNLCAAGSSCSCSALDSMTGTLYFMPSLARQNY